MRNLFSSTLNVPDVHPFFQQFVTSAEAEIHWGQGPLAAAGLYSQTMRTACKLAELLTDEDPETIALLEANDVTLSDLIKTAEALTDRIESLYLQVH